MILSEPPPTQGDIHFRLFGFPVRIHPFFWLVSLIIALQGSQTPPAVVINWIIAVLVSILIHELGHAVLQRHFGGNPRIVLHGMGGLAICNDCDRSSRSQILISLAGPFAGFLLAGLLAVGVVITGHQLGIDFHSKPELTFKASGLRLLGVWLLWEAYSSPHVNLLIGNLFQINILWGIINLLPIYPLDGGHVSREICLLSSDSRSGMILSLQISMFTAIAVAIYGLTTQSLFFVLMFGYFAYSSYKTLEAYRASAW